MHALGDSVRYISEMSLTALVLSTGMEYHCFWLCDGSAE